MVVALTGLENKVAIVTGAGRMRSIGRPIAVEFARAGCDVVLTGTGRPPHLRPADEIEAGWQDIESVAEEVRALGRRAFAVVSDVADSAAVDQLVQDVVDEFGRIDFLINNAGAARGEDRVPVVQLSDDLWDTVMRVNVYGTFYMSRAVARHLLDAGRGGSIVNISSIAGKLGSANTAAYSSSKAAVGALTSSMSFELAPSGIRVNAICPGVIDTSRMDDIPRGEPWERVVKMIPLQRAGTGEDIAWTTAFLCSDQGSWVSGQQWNVDGGQVTVR
jgi:NAD(P)-dependent dehydrogenase (short-subunit alcohol dehydrogenase family)